MKAQNLNNDLKFWASFFVGTLLIIWGFVAPPYGEISQSVLVASGEFLVLAAAIVGVDLSLDFKNLKIKQKEKTEEEK